MIRCERIGSKIKLMKYLFASVGPLLRPLVVDLLEGSISVPVDNIYFGFTIP